jgi:hypothetical protein
VFYPDKEIRRLRYYSQFFNTDDLLDQKVYFVRSHSRDIGHSFCPIVNHDYTRNPVKLLLRNIAIRDSIFIFNLRLFELMDGYTNNFHIKN